LLQVFISRLCNTQLADAIGAEKRPAKDVNRKLAHYHYCCRM
jgi:hypothetical protein